MDFGVQVFVKHHLHKKELLSPNFSIFSCLVRVTQSLTLLYTFLCYSRVSTVSTHFKEASLHNFILLYYCQSTKARAQPVLQTAILFKTIVSYKYILITFQYLLSKCVSDQSFSSRPWLPQSAPWPTSPITA